MATTGQLRESLERIAKARVTVFGDFCLDAYWLLDDQQTELSIETGLPLRRVREQRYSLGGAGNVVANLVDLGVHAVRAVGVVGKDVFGYALHALLEEKAVHLDGFEIDHAWQTMVYAKPCAGGREDNRIDFGAFNAMWSEMEDRLLDNLKQAAAASDIVILNQQVPRGVTGDSMLRKLNKVITSHPDVKFLVDARHTPALYAPSILKLNATEACRYIGVPEHADLPEAKAVEFAASIHRKTGKPAFITRGEQGMVFAEDGAVGLVAGLHIAGEVDTVGAGDTVASALAAVLGSGGGSQMAAEIANLAAMVTVQKLRTTGTATPQEILRAAADTLSKSETQNALESA